MKKKILSLLLISVLAFSLFGCGSKDEDKGQTTDNGTEVTEGKTEGAGEITLEDVNKFLNESGDLGPGSIANSVAVIPFKHIDGGDIDSDFYAFVNFQYKESEYVKYQVSFVSCTWRPQAVNYWQNAYVELSLPESKNIDDVVVRTISFDKDGTDHYQAAAWGDSNPIPTNGVTYETFKEEYIPFFIGKEYSYLKDLSVYKDINIEDYKAGEGRDGFEIDTYSGSSVSANNIIRILDSLKDHHEKTYLK